MGILLRATRNLECGMRGTGTVLEYRCTRTRSVLEYGHGRSPWYCAGGGREVIVAVAASAAVTVRCQSHVTGRLVFG